MVAQLLLISTIVRSISNPTNSLVIHDCAIFQIVGVTVIWLEVDNRLAVCDF